MPDPGSRLRYARRKWDLTPEALPERSGVAVGTIRRVEAGMADLDTWTEDRLASSLHIRAAWLLTGRDGMLSLGDMSAAEQHRAQSGPGTEGLPGYVVIPGGVWYRDARGTWQVDYQL